MAQSHTPPVAPEQPHSLANSPTFRQRKRRLVRVKCRAITQNRAVFAADRAIRCHFLAAIVPLLPPITQNVKFSRAANRLELRMREEDGLDTKLKKRQKRQC